MNAALSQLLESLRSRALAQAGDFADGHYVIAGHPAELESTRLVKAVKIACPDDPEAHLDALLGCSAALQRYLPFASSPASTMLAWSWRESTLTSDAALTLSDAGGILIPKSERDALLKPAQKGLVLEHNCLFAIRHAPGNYPDSCDLNGRLTYQPTVNRTGPPNHLSLVRFRLAELLAASSLPGGVLLLVMWLKYPAFGAQHDTVLMLCPALVESLHERWSESIGAPLRLKLITRYEALVRTQLVVESGPAALVAASRL